MDLKPLFLEHLQKLQAHAEKALDYCGFQALVISAGEPYTYFADDCDAPFRRTPHFSHWCPLMGPHHLLQIETGKKPKLIRFAPEDFWFEQLPLDNPFWLEGFEFKEVGKLDEAWKELSTFKRAAYIGNETGRAAAQGLACNDSVLTAYLDWGRSYKSAYELVCTDEAAQKAAIGHKAAREAFFRGESELEIHQAFVRAVGCMDEDLSFSSIVALNEKAATLHYENKRPHVRKGKVGLVDAGCRHLGYASDITRTYASQECDPRFVALLKGMDTLQRRLCELPRAGMAFGELHHQCHMMIAQLLKDQGILHSDPQESVEQGFTRVFLPHGLGHFMGIEVHDMAGRQANPQGAMQPPPDIYPSLRTTRTLEVGHLFTIEPGLYFIEMLQRPFRSGDKAEYSKHFNWELIDALAPLGGIRIEDDIYLDESGPRNLTRPYLPE